MLCGAVSLLLRRITSSYQLPPNRQELLISKLGKYYEWTKEQAEQHRKIADTTAKPDYTPEIVRDSLPEHELDEQRLLQHYGLAVHLHAHLTSIMESMDGQACGYYIALYAKLNWKKVPLSSTFLWMLCAKNLGLLSKERWEMRVEHLEAPL